MFIPPALVINSPEPGIRVGNAKDGNWWMSISVKQRQGFLNGFLDCSINEAKSTRFKSSSVSILEPFITEFIEKHPSERSRHLDELLSTIKLPKPIHAPPGGEVYTGRHGYFIGEFWRQALRQERIGYIEGYIQAIKFYNTGTGLYTKNSEWYEKRISSWFGIEDENDDGMDVKKEDVPIADALHRFRDK